MTVMVPSGLGSKDAFVNWVVSRAGELRSHADLAQEGDGNLTHAYKSVAALLECAEFVRQIESMSEFLPGKNTPATSRDYTVLSIGHLRTVGFMADVIENGVMTLPGVGGSYEIAVQPSMSGYELKIGEEACGQRIVISHTSPSFGGSRFWFHCPGLGDSRCSRRTLKLYRSEDAATFACRLCHRNSHDNGWRTVRDRRLLRPLIDHAA